jgi:hypothetical protein
MNRFKLAGAALVLCAASTACATRQPTSSEEGGAPPSPVVAELQLFAKYAGAWDAEVEMADEQGGAPTITKAVANGRVACGGLWLITDFEGTMMGMPFSGHEVSGYDVLQKKYTMTWVDSMTPTASTGSGHFDAATNTMTMQVSGADAAGQPSNFRGVDTWTDADHHTWTMMVTGPDGNEFPAMTIRYSRRK